MNKEHATWDLMRPNENEKYQDFRFKQYYDRISKTKLNHIPNAVFEQWIYFHHQEANTLKNYAWLNYENIEFRLCQWPTEKLAGVSVIGNFRDLYNDRSSCSYLTQFSCTEEDLLAWQNEGTWRIPPIVIDVTSLHSVIPKWSELKSPYQLVEGHNRLGYLHSLINISKQQQVKLADEHWIYLMIEK